MGARADPGGHEADAGEAEARRGGQDGGRQGGVWGGGEAQVGCELCGGVDLDGKVRGRLDIATRRGGGVRNDVRIMYIDRALRTDAGHDTLSVNFAYELHAGSSRSRTAHAS